MKQWFLQTQNYETLLLHNNNNKKRISNDTERQQHSQKRIEPIFWSISAIADTKITQKEMSSCMKKDNISTWDNWKYCKGVLSLYWVTVQLACVFQAKNSHVHKLFYKIIKFSCSFFKSI